jgi:hypothetical protein
MTDLRRTNDSTRVDADGTIVASGFAGPSTAGGVTGRATTIAFAVAFVALAAIIVATALTGPAGASPIDAMSLPPARDAQFVVIDTAAGGSGPGAMVLLTAMLFGMAAAAGAAWRALTRAAVRPRNDIRVRVHR